MIINGKNNFEEYSEEQRIKFYNATNKADCGVEDVLNKPLKPKFVISRDVEQTNDETGEIKTSTITTFILEDGTSVACMSAGVKFSLANICSIFGADPAKWPGKIKFVKVKAKKGNTFTIQLV